MNDYEIDFATAMVVAEQTHGDRMTYNKLNRELQKLREKTISLLDKMRKGEGNVLGTEGRRASRYFRRLEIVENEIAKFIKKRM